MGIFEIFTIVFSNPIINILVALYKLLFLLGVPFALGFSIILLTIVIRVILYPFVSAQIKSAHKMQKVAPHMSKIKALHKDDKKRQQEEIMKLYREHGVNPAASCLPMIVQLPIIWALYQVLITVVGIKSIEAIGKINSVLYFPALKLNQVWDTLFFGLPLADSPSKLIAHNPFIILIPIITGIFQFILSKMMMPDEVIEQAVVKKDDFQATFQKQSLFIFPVMIGYFSFILPVGLALYWNTYTIFGILQQYLLIGPGGAKSWVDRIKK
ncbi:MAG: hypothetical protein COU27_02510 [Candidatus Levybacteria bacterium CG10_big_fil_rev_8_21_14_0_10_36_7]|nr:MAG: hypothetical protein COU27_02510 [Candidatus Levybacteria bacterium CG10_big_fil_rev_8_21_14_0_10_36_7]